MGFSIFSKQKTLQYKPTQSEQIFLSMDFYSPLALREKRKIYIGS